MNSRITALLLHNREEPLRSFKAVLDRQSVESIRARSCTEALRIMKNPRPPEIIFTDLTTSDDSWAGALLLARKADVPVNLIVVSDVPDLALCQAAIDCGAFSYIIPPVPDSQLSRLVERAAEAVISRRRERPTVLSGPVLVAQPKRHEAARAVFKA